MPALGYERVDDLGGPVVTVCPLAACRCGRRCSKGERRSPADSNPGEDPPVNATASSVPDV